MEYVDAVFDSLGNSFSVFFAHVIPVEVGKLTALVGGTAFVTYVFGFMSGISHANGKKEKK